MKYIIIVVIVFLAHWLIDKFRTGDEALVEINKGEL